MAPKASAAEAQKAEFFSGVRYGDRQKVYQKYMAMGDPAGALIFAAPLASSRCLLYRKGGRGGRGGRVSGDDFLKLEVTLFLHPGARLPMFWEQTFPTAHRRQRAGSSTSTTRRRGAWLSCTKNSKTLSALRIQFYAIGLLCFKSSFRSGVGQECFWANTKISPPASRRAHSVFFPGSNLAQIRPGSPT